MKILLIKNKISNADSDLNSLIKELKNGGHEPCLYFGEFIDNDIFEKIRSKGINIIDSHLIQTHELETDYDRFAMFDEWPEIEGSFKSIKAQNMEIPSVINALNEHDPVIDSVEEEEEEEEKYKSVSIVVPVYNNFEYTMAFIESALLNTRVPFELIFVNNASTDDTHLFIDLMKKRDADVLKDVNSIENSTNLGFVKAFNQGVKLAKGKYIVGFNNDVLLAPNWLENLIEVAESDEDAGIVSLSGNVGGKQQNVLNINGIPKPNNSNVKEIDQIMKEKFSGQIVEAETSVPFSLALIKREVVNEIGYLSEDFGVGLGDDGDYCLRAKKAGFKILVKKDSYFYHFGRTTFKTLYSDEEIIEMSKRGTKLIEEKHPEFFGEGENPTYDRNVPRETIDEFEKEDEEWDEDFDEVMDDFLKPKKFGKINILLTNNHLVGLGGSEMFTYTMAKELKSRGHNVNVMTISASDKMREFFSKMGVAVMDCGVARVNPDIYDLILCNHNSTLVKLDKINARKIFTSHGVYPELERPVEGADAYISISDEVQKKNIERGFDSGIIKNGIDLDRFKPSMARGRVKPKKVLAMCQGEDARAKVKQACDELKLECDLVDERVIDIEERMKDVDIVFTLGRGAIEAMASGKNVIVYDSRPYMPSYADGLITAKNVDEISKNNFSGRAFQKEWEVEDIKKEIKKYKQAICTWGREYVEDNHDIKNSVDKYLLIYEIL